MNHDLSSLRAALSGLFPLTSRQPFYRCCHLMTLIILPVLVASACTPTAGDPTPEGLLNVVTTTGLIGDAAQRIAGEHAAVSSLMGPGIDPHLYKASEGDVRRLANADLILYHGLFLEGAMAEILGKLARTRPAVAVAEVLSKDQLLDFAAAGKAYDPHIWFDPELWTQVLEPIVEALAAQRPDLRAEFEANAEVFRSQLIDLNQWAQQRLLQVPESTRVLVTAHDAFGYFGRRYDFQVVGIQGISTATEAGLQDVERVVDLVVSRRVPAIFVESTVSRRSVEAIQAACRDRGWDVAIGGQLYSDAMGPADSDAGNYLGMVRANVETIATALGAATTSEFTGVRAQTDQDAKPIAIGAVSAGA